MLLHSALCFCFLIAFVGGALTRDELYSKIGNKHMLEDEDVRSLINAQKPVLYEEYLARDCRAAFLRGRKRSGIYIIHPKFSPLLVVYCDMHSDGGGWTVLHRNIVSQKSTLWSNNWSRYKTGFGGLLRNHWLGNEAMHLITRQNAFLVRFVIMDSKGQVRHADYESFRVDSEDADYALRLGNYSGDAGDALTSWYEPGIHDNMRFSAKDRDNDLRVNTNCALDNGAGWWYNNCFAALLTSNSHIYWKGLCTEATKCTLASIMIRPNGKNCEVSSR